MDEKSREILTKIGFREDFDFENKWHIKDTVRYKDRRFLISTVDLGIDHNYGGSRPLYFETMIFEIIGPDEEKDIDFGGVYQNRYSTKEEARSHHKYLVNAFDVGDAKLENGYFEL